MCPPDILLLAPSPVAILRPPLQGQCLVLEGALVVIVYPRREQFVTVALNCVIKNVHFEIRRHSKQSARSGCVIFSKAAFRRRFKLCDNWGTRNMYTSLNILLDDPFIRMVLYAIHFLKIAIIFIVGLEKKKTVGTKCRKTFFYPRVEFQKKYGSVI